MIAKIFNIETKYCRNMKYLILLIILSSCSINRIAIKTGQEWSHRHNCHQDSTEQRIVLKIKNDRVLYTTPHNDTILIHIRAFPVCSTKIN